MQTLNNGNESPREKNKKKALKIRLPFCNYFKFSSDVTSKAEKDQETNF